MTMPKLIGGKRLTEMISRNKLMDNYTFDSGKSDNIKYDFIVDSLILGTGFDGPVDIKERKDISIKPGEILYVQCKEDIHLPNNVFAQLSTKRKLSEKGIEVLGGFIIDPGYKGKLLFGMKNNGHCEFPFLPGRKLVGAVFFELDEDEIDFSKAPPDAIDPFSPELINFVKNSKPLSLEKFEKEILTFSEQLDELEKDIIRIKRNQENDNASIGKLHEIVDKNNRQIKETQENVEKSSHSIDKILRALEIESDTRAKEDNRLEYQTKENNLKVEKQLAFIKGMGFIISIIVTIVILPIFLDFIRELLK